MIIDKINEWKNVVREKKWLLKITVIKKKYLVKK